MKNKLTKKGYKTLLEEFEDITKVKRPKIVQGITIAAAEGDRSENAEYIYGKKHLREIDRRLKYLSVLLKEPLVISKKDVNTKQVSFGTKVTVLSIFEDKEEQKTWTIVGEGEADYKQNTISEQSVVAKSIMGKTIGDLIEVNLPKGTTEFEILAIAVGDID